MGVEEVVVLVDRLREGLGPIVQVLHAVAGGGHHCTALRDQVTDHPPTDLTIDILNQRK